MGMTRLQVRKVDGNWALAKVFVYEGSNSTLMRQVFANYLNLRGTRHLLTIIGAGNVINRYPSQRITFDIRDTNGETISIPCSTLPSVASDTPVTDGLSLKQR
jgi:formylmethanofuran dehydrogenase subunit E-like metal-binding protein